MAKYLGLDLGSVTCGVAISDLSGFLARTYSTIRFKEDDYDYCLNEVVNICQKENVKDIVLGLPKHMNGDVGIRGNISIEFKQKLEEKGFKVYLVDERLTTVLANNYMLQADMRRDKRREKKDELAAQIILQTFLDGGKK